MKKLYILSFFIFMTATIFLSNKREPIKEYDISKFINTTLLDLANKDTAKVDLCKINEFDWEQLIIVPQYTSIKFLKELKIKNRNDIKDQYKIVKQNDAKTLYLFLKNDSIVRYSIITNNKYPLRMYSINHDAQYRRIPKQELCNKLYAERSTPFFYLKM